jgi:hypothetical protein
MKKLLLWLLAVIVGSCVAGSGEPLRSETVFQEVIKIPILESDECGEVVWQWGNAFNTKTELRDFTKPVYLQVHQTDYWPGEDGSSIKTNLYVSTKGVYQIHPPEVVIKSNYDDIYHVEVAWVSPSRTTVVDHGVTFHREADVWTPEREALLETALCYAVLQLRARGVEPVIITHRQTYWARELDPDLDIAQATYRIAKKHGFRLDFEWTRPGGQSAALWYPFGGAALDARRRPAVPTKRISFSFGLVLSGLGEVAFDWGATWMGSFSATLGGCLGMRWLFFGYSSKSVAGLP